MADNHDQAGYVSDFLGAVAEFRGYLVDKLNEVDLGTTGGGGIGALGDLIGLADAIDQYMESDRGENATTGLAFDIASTFSLPVDVANRIREKLGEIFDQGENEAELTRELVDFSKFLDKLLDPKTKTWWDRAKDWLPHYDPLTLDLDNDGLETVGASTTNPILFDHDGDGIKNGTGWIASDDAMLVLDRNGNGAIDNGRELFGNNTIKSNGQTATDGFDALADLDSNADGVVNNQDAQFANLKLWRDLNQDGISQTGELFTLNDLGIASINIANTANSQTLANGNQLTNTGTYTKADGSTGSVADINLADDTFHREFGNVLDTTTVASLPDMQACPEHGRRGSGAVRDLREAANDGDWRVAA